MSDPLPDPLRAAGQGSEDEAWARVVAAWGDEQEHRAYLARFHDLEGLGVAGKRYRGVLAARPEDAMAARMRDEVLKRATVQGLASLPRTRPRKAPPIVKKLLLAGAILAAIALGWSLLRFFALLEARP